MSSGSAIPWGIPSPPGQPSTSVFFPFLTPICFVLAIILYACCGSNKQQQQHQQHQQQHQQHQQQQHQQQQQQQQQQQRQDRVPQVYPSPKNHLQTKQADEIPVQVYSCSGSDSPGKKETCRICLMEFVGGQEVKSLPRCGHLFHKDCVDELLATGFKSCPLCRNQILHFSEDDEQHVGIDIDAVAN